MITIIRLSAVLLTGPRYWLVLLLPLLWLAGHAALLVAGLRTSFEPAVAQNTLIGAPATVLAVFLGGRIIGGELDERTLEIAYTVPGGTHRVWLGKLAAAGLILLATLSLAAVLTFTFLTPFPIAQTLYGAAQGAAFYLSAAMGLATLFRSEVTGAMGTMGVLGLDVSITLQAKRPFPISPFWNPLAGNATDAQQLLATSVQNRIGFALIIAAIVALTFARAERREKMLG